MELSEENKKLLNNLEQLKNKCSNIGYDLFKINPNLYSVDFASFAIINRSLYTISGFITLIENNNFLSSTTSIRVHLDTLLTLYAISIIEDKDQFINHIVSGGQKDKYKDENNEQLTDSFLSKKFFEDPKNKKWKELKAVYKETSRFIHFSDKHIASIFQKTPTTKNKNEFKILISEQSHQFNNQEVKNMIACMVLITDAQIAYLNGWIEIKKEALEKSSKN